MTSDEHSFQYVNESNDQEGADSVVCAGQPIPSVDFSIGNTRTMTTHLQ